MKLWEVILACCAGIGVTFLLIFAIYTDKQNLIERKSNFFSQCQLDGYKATDCYYKWKMIN